MAQKFIRNNVASILQGCLHLRAPGTCYACNSMCHAGACVQRTSSELESVWRMQVIRERDQSKRDVWKRCAFAVAPKCWGSNGKPRLAVQQGNDTHAC